MTLILLVSDSIVARVNGKITKIQNNQAIYHSFASCSTTNRHKWFYLVRETWLWIKFVSSYLLIILISADQNSVCDSKFFMVQHRWSLSSWHSVDLSLSWRTLIWRNLCWLLDCTGQWYWLETVGILLTSRKRFFVVNHLRWARFLLLLFDSVRTRLYTV